MSTKTYWYTTSDGSQAGATRAALIEISPAVRYGRRVRLCVATVIDLTAPMNVPYDCPDYCGTVEAKYEKSWCDWQDDDTLVLDMLNIIGWPLPSTDDNL